MILLYINNKYIYKSYIIYMILYIHTISIIFDSIKIKKVTSIL